jgi:hypothetical protein
MSTLFRVKIESVSGATVKARFEVCHPDQWEVPGSASFALQTVVEVFWNMKMGYRLHGNDGHPIAEVEAALRVREHPHRAQLEAWLELAHGKTVPISEEEYKRLGSSGRREEKVAGYGLRDDVYYKFYDPEYTRFVAEATRAIVEVHLEDEVGNPKQDDNDPDPEATLVFTVRDAAHLFHMVEGVCFEAAMYDFSRCCGGA